MSQSDRKRESEEVEEEGKKKKTRNRLAVTYIVAGTRLAAIRPNLHKYTNM